MELIIQPQNRPKQPLLCLCLSVRIILQKCTEEVLAKLNGNSKKFQIPARILEDMIKFG